MITLKYTIDGQDFSRDLQPGNYIVGRSKSCDIVIFEASISGQHLRIDVAENGEASFRDLLSRNGTRLKGKKVQQGSLIDGTRIQLGHVDIEVKSDVVNASDGNDNLDDFAAPPPMNSVSEERAFDFAPAPVPVPVDAEFSDSEISGNGSVEIFRPSFEQPVGA